MLPREGGVKWVISCRVGLAAGEGLLRQRRCRAVEAGRDDGGRSLHPVAGPGGVKSGSASGLHPTLRKSAKDGAPELLGWSRVGQPARPVLGRVSDVSRGPIGYSAQGLVRVDEKYEIGRA